MLQDGRGGSGGVTVVFRGCPPAGTDVKDTFNLSSVRDVHLLLRHVGGRKCQISFVPRSARDFVGALATRTAGSVSVLASGRMRRYGGGFSGTCVSFFTAFPRSMGQRVRGS